MSKPVAALETEMRSNPKNVRFSDAIRVAEHYFGKPRIRSSHCIFRMPWPSDPRVNLQEAKNGQAKAYQVRQLLLAIDKSKLSESV